MRLKKCVRLSADCIKLEHSAMQNALVNLAGAVRFELTTKVLETHVLPLHHAPSLTHKPTNIYYYIYFQAICQYLFEKFFIKNKYPLKFFDFMRIFTSEILSKIILYMFRLQTKPLWFCLLYSWRSLRCSLIKNHFWRHVRQK